MKTVVIGGTGLIGSKTVAILRQGGHEVVPLGQARLGRIGFDEWHRRSQAAA
jgi:nucleoside-diphosphate-sugar epimerase